MEIGYAAGVSDTKGQIAGVGLANAVKEIEEAEQLARTMGMGQPPQ